MIKAGELKQRITILRMAEVRESDGGIVPTPQAVATVWAAVEPLQGRELFQARQIAPDVTARVKLRYRPDIDSTHRILYGSRVFDIVSPPINVEERNEELQFLCREVIDP